jgi:hypothetical protein
MQHGYWSVLKRHSKKRELLLKRLLKHPKNSNFDEKWLKMSANTIIPSGVVLTEDGRYYLIIKNEKQQ